MATRCIKAEDVGVRLYYDPLIKGEKTVHGPCIFLPVSSQDPRLGQRPAWVLYVTLSDLRKELALLAEQQFSWTDSPNPKQLIVDAFDLKLPPHGGMEIVVTCPEGSAVTEVESRKICGLLSDMSKVLRNAKARDSLAFYAKTVYCSETPSTDTPSSNDHR